MHLHLAKPPNSFFIMAMADPQFSGVRGVGFTIVLEVQQISNFKPSLKARWAKARVVWKRLLDEGQPEAPLAGDDRWRWTGKVRA